MNDSRLRQLLLDATAVVASPSPSVAGLRQENSRRQRRRGLTAAVVASAVLAAALGLVVSVHHNRVTPARPAVVTVPCVSAIVDVTVGQTVRVAACQADNQLDSLGGFIGSPVVSVTTQSYAAVQAGAVILEIHRVIHRYCSECLGGPNLPPVGKITILVRGAAGSPNPVVTVPCTTRTATIQVGQLLSVDGCPPGGLFSLLGDGVARQTGPPGLGVIALDAGSFSLNGGFACNKDPAPGLVCRNGSATVTISITASAPTQHTVDGVVLVPCSAESATVDIGQYLKLEGCPPGTQVTGMPQLLHETARGLIAASPGSETVSLDYDHCDLLPPSMSQTCTGGRDQQYLSVLVRASGGASGLHS